MAMVGYEENFRKHSLLSVQVTAMTNHTDLLWADHGMSRGVMIKSARAPLVVQLPVAMYMNLRVRTDVAVAMAMGMQVVAVASLLLQQSGDANTCAAVVLDLMEMHQFNTSLLIAVARRPFQIRAVYTTVHAVDPFVAASVLKEMPDDGPLDGMMTRIAVFRRCQRFGAETASMINAAHADTTTAFSELLHIYPRFHSCFSRAPFLHQTRRPVAVDSGAAGAVSSPALTAHQALKLLHRHDVSTFRVAMPVNHRPSALPSTQSLLEEADARAVTNTTEHRLDDEIAVLHRVLLHFAQMAFRTDHTSADDGMPTRTLSAHLRQPRVMRLNDAVLDTAHRLAFLQWTAASPPADLQHLFHACMLAVLANDPHEPVPLAHFDAVPATALSTAAPAASALPLKVLARSASARLQHVADMASTRTPDAVIRRHSKLAETLHTSVSIPDDAARHAMNRHFPTQDPNPVDVLPFHARSLGRQMEADVDVNSVSPLAIAVGEFPIVRASASGTDHMHSPHAREVDEEILDHLDRLEHVPARPDVHARSRTAAEPGLADDPSSNAVTVVHLLPRHDLVSPAASATHNATMRLLAARHTTDQLSHVASASTVLKMIQHLGCDEAIVSTHRTVNSRPRAGTALLPHVHHALHASTVDGFLHRNHDLAMAGVEVAFAAMHTLPATHHVSQKAHMPPHAASVAADGAVFDCEAKQAPVSATARDGPPPFPAMAGQLVALHCSRALVVAVVRPELHQHLHDALARAVVAFAHASPMHGGTRAAVGPATMDDAATVAFSVATEADVQHTAHLVAGLTGGGVHSTLGTSAARHVARQLAHLAHERLRAHAFVAQESAATAAHLVLTPRMAESAGTGAELLHEGLVLPAAAFVFPNAALPAAGGVGAHFFQTSAALRTNTSMTVQHVSMLALASFPVRQMVALKFGSKEVMLTCMRAMTSASKTNLLGTAFPAWMNKPRVFLAARDMRHVSLRNAFSVFGPHKVLDGYTSLAIATFTDELSTVRTSTMHHASRHLPLTVALPDSKHNLGALCQALHASGLVNARRWTLGQCVVPSHVDRPALPEFHLLPRCGDLHEDAFHALDVSSRSRTVVPRKVVMSASPDIYSFV